MERSAAVEFGIEGLIRLAKDMRNGLAGAVSLELREHELAFYDALEVSNSTVKALEEPTLVKIFREVVETAKKEESHHRLAEM